MKINVYDYLQHKSSSGNYIKTNMMGVKPTV